MFKTFQYRIKDSSQKNYLIKQSGKVNFVWNYCNATTTIAWKRDHQWLSKYNLQDLVSGSSTEINLNAAIIQLVVHEHTRKRSQFKKCKLRFRSRKKKTLGWIPLDTRCLKILEDSFIVSKRKFRIWKHRQIEGQVKTATICENSKGQWFINITCELPTTPPVEVKTTLGVDLNFSNTAVCSDGQIFTNPKATRVYADKLAIAQRANKKRQVTNLHLKIKNIRKDSNHKISKKIRSSADKIFVGNVSSNAMISCGKGFAKSATDVAWGQLRTMLNYKAISLGKVCVPINEAWSSLTCSVCLERGEHSGLRGLGVRRWVCKSCHTEHDRDVNAALNINNVGVGLYSLFKQEAYV